MSREWATVACLSDGSRDRVARTLERAIAGLALNSDGDALILSKLGEKALRDGLTGRELDLVTSFSSTPASAFLLQNLPQESFPPTPVSGYVNEPLLATTNALHLGLVALMGLVPFSVDYENDGRLLRNVVANPAASGVASSWGADSEFFWHTDNPHLGFGSGIADPRQHIPAHLVFYAVRNVEKVPTEAVLLRDVLAELGDETVETLRSASFEVGPAASNDCPGNDVLPALPLVERIDGRDCVRFDRGTTVGRSRAANEALAAWGAALARTRAEEFVLDAGDLLVIDNYALLHQRRAFTPAPRSDSRWLRRCYAS